MTKQEIIPVIRSHCRSLMNEWGYDSGLIKNELLEAELAWRYPSVPQTWVRVAVLEEIAKGEKETRS